MVVFNNKKYFLTLFLVSMAGFMVGSMDQQLGDYSDDELASVAGLQGGEPSYDPNSLAYGVGADDLQDVGSSSQAQQRVDASRHSVNDVMSTIKEKTNDTLREIGRSLASSDRVYSEGDNETNTIAASDRPDRGLSNVEIMRKYLPAELKQYSPQDVAKPNKQDLLKIYNFVESKIRASHGTGKMPWSKDYYYLGQEFTPEDMSFLYQYVNAFFL